MLYEIIHASLNSGLKNWGLLRNTGFYKVFRQSIISKDKTNSRIRERHIFGIQLTPGLEI